MYARLFLLFALLTLSFPLFAESTQKDKIRTQNLEVVRMAAREISSKLPQKVDAYTQLVAIEPKGESLIYTFEIHAGAKSDATIIREAGERKMNERVLRGICISSRRFIESGIAISYLYRSAASKKMLFRYDADAAKCKDVMGPGY